MSEEIKGAENYKSLTEIDNLRLDYYKKNPELIVESTEWAATGVCAVCFGKIPLDNKCFRNKHINVRDYYSNPDLVAKEIPTCPICKYSNKNFLLEKEKEYKRVYIGIPCITIRYRYHIVGRTYKRNFLGFITKCNINKIQETQIVSVDIDINQFMQNILSKNEQYARAI